LDYNQVLAIFDYFVDTQQIFAELVVVSVVSAQQEPADFGSSQQADYIAVAIIAVVATIVVLVVEAKYYLHSDFAEELVVNQYFDLAALFGKKDQPLNQKKQNKITMSLRALAWQSIENQFISHRLLHFIRNDYLTKQIYVRFLIKFANQK